MEDSDKFSVLLGMFSDEIGNFRNSPKGSQMLLMVRNFFFWSIREDTDGFIREKH